MQIPKSIAQTDSVRAEDLSRLTSIIKNHPHTTPYMLTDLAVVRKRATQFRTFLPQVKIFYAAKCFSDDEVIKQLDGLVEGYDVASVEEIKKIRSLGIDSSRLIFSNPVKSESALRAAEDLSVKKFAYQSYNELVKIKKHVHNAQVYVRLKVEDNTSALTFSDKFGCDYEQALDLLLKARELGLKPIGISFHVGSQATGTGVWGKALEQATQLIAEAKNNNLELTFLNIGGGFPVEYAANDTGFSETAAAINNAIQEYAHHDLDIVAEPGRHMVADSSVIVTSIIGVEEREDKTWLYLDVGTFQAFIEVFEFGYFPYPVYSVDHLIGELPQNELKKYVLTGPSCDSYDTMAAEVTLPADLAIGNKLLIDKAGAYTVVYGSNFNGFKVPERHFIDLEDKEYKT